MYFAFLCFLNGGNRSSYRDVPRSQPFPFCIHIIFLVLSEPHYLLLFYDIFDCTHKAQRISVEHNSLFAVWLGSSTISFLHPTRLIRIEHIFLFLYPAQLIRIE